MKIEVGKKYRFSDGEVGVCTRYSSWTRGYDVAVINMDVGGSRFVSPQSGHGVLETGWQVLEEVVEPDPHIGKRYVLDGFDGGVFEVLSSKASRIEGVRYECACIETGWKMWVRAGELTEEYVPPPPKKRFYVTATVELEVRAENIDVARNMASRYIDTAQFDDVSLEDYHTHEVIED